MRKIQPFASKVPYMTSPGNHGEFKIKLYVSSKCALITT